MLSKKLTKVRDKIFYRAWKEYVKIPKKENAKTVEDLLKILNEGMGLKNAYRIISKERKKDDELL